MKKNKNILGVILLFICLISCIIILDFINIDIEKNECEINYDDILFEVNTALNSQFSISNNLDVSIPLNFSEGTDYIIALDKMEETQQDYFIMVKDINESNFLGLETLVKMINLDSQDKVVEIKKHGAYTYVIVSKKFESTIDGIIRSYIYCN